MQYFFVIHIKEIYNTNRYGKILLLLLFRKIIFFQTEIPLI